MHEIIFEGIGTHWEILYESVDKDGRDDKLKEEILQAVTDFDHRYSRFRKNSLVWQIANSNKMRHKIESEMVEMLKFGKKLELATHGSFNPAVGYVMERIGYDSEYSFVPKTSEQHPCLSWSLDDSMLITPKPILFDIGGWGKGFLIDRVSSILTANNIDYFLVNGGGDIYGTTKPDGSAWRVALEHPNNDEQAFGLVEIRNSAIASTGPTKRKFGSLHHLVDPWEEASINTIVGVHVQARTAVVADGVATALFVDQLNHADSMQKLFDVEYLAIFPELTYKKSTGFKIRLFK